MRDVPALGASRESARICRPGSLDASRTEGAIVLCERGGIGRVVKSQAVDQADAVGMVLANVGPGGVESDLHSVPTVHLRQDAARTLEKWAARHPHGRVTLAPAGLRNPARKVTIWSSSGDPTATVVKPDVVAPAVGILGAVPPSVRGTRWDFVTGTSAATAWTSGLALRLLADHHRWSADVVRSALVTSADSVTGHPSVLSEGAGLPRPARAERPGLAYRVGTGDYRAWLGGHLDGELNAPSILLPHDQTHAVRSITNVGRRRATFTVSVTGFAEHQVSVTPATVRLGARPHRHLPGACQRSRPDRTGRRRLDHLGLVRRHHRPDPGRPHPLTRRTATGQRAACGSAQTQLGGGLLAHLDLADLAGHGHRELVDDQDVARDLVVRELARGVRANRVGVQRSRRRPSS